MTTTAVAPDSLPSKAQKRLDMAWAEDLQMTNTQRAVDFYADQNSGRERPTPNAGYQRYRLKGLCKSAQPKAWNMDRSAGRTAHNIVRNNCALILCYQRLAKAENDRPSRRWARL